MKFSEFRTVSESKQLGRAFNHLEDLVFFHGSKGALAAAEHLNDFANTKGSDSIRMKWDGNPQIYWGREEVDGPLVLVGHNQWSRGVTATSQEEIVDFIVNKSGNPKTPEEVAKRQEFAQSFANLYPLFDAATPKNFKGYVYADGLFLSRPEIQDGVYSFSPNPRSQTTYHVTAESDLGQRISSAEVMIVGHAFFPEFGMSDNKQQPITDFSQFDNNPNLIVMGPVYNTTPVEVDTSELDKIKSYASKNAERIDGFLESIPGLADLKNIVYTYVNQTAKAKQLDSIGAKHFFNWLNTSKVSKPKQIKIQDLNNTHNDALDIIFVLVKSIQDAKDKVISQVEGKQGDIWDTDGEGRVRYADVETKKFGNVKLVPRKRWTPA